jgi:hypothetical protein
LTSTPRIPHYYLIRQKFGLSDEIPQFVRAMVQFVHFLLTTTAEFKELALDVAGGWRIWWKNINAESTACPFFAGQRANW